MGFGGKRPWVIAAGAGGVALVGLGWWSSRDWEAVAIEVGASIALVVVLIWLEDAWKSSVEQRVAAAESKVDEVSDELTRLANAQAASVQVRNRTHDALIEEFRGNPRPATLWPIAERCKQLGLSVAQQVALTAQATLTVVPESADVTRLIIGTVNNRTDRFDWRADMDLVRLIHRVDESLAKLGAHPGDDEFRFGAAIEAIADTYSTVIASAFRPAQPST